MQKVRVFIGTEPKTEIARKVLQHSIIKNTKKPELIEFPDLMGEHWVSKPELGVGTGFSLKRWEIPELCDYKGCAIYLDADMLVFGDVLELWQADINYPNELSSVWCTFQPCKWYNYKTPETSVMFIDCEKARNNQKDLAAIKEYLEDDKDRMKYVSVMRGLDHQHAPQMIGTSWNHLNVYHPEKTKLLHYTKEPEQPWYYPDHPLRSLWEDALKDAVDDNCVSKKEIKKAIDMFTPHTKGKRGFGLNPHYKYLIK